MAADRVYMDNHSTTRVDDRVVQEMLPYFTEFFGNAGSTSHSFGWEARDAVDKARNSLAKNIGAKARELIFTSGATESNNLAIRGLADRLESKGKHLISVVTEHRAVLDPLDRLSRRGFEVTLLPVRPHENKDAGLIDLNELQAAIRDDTILVSVMLANNEIGTIQPLAEISQICQERGVALHCDATQAVGRIPIDVNELGVDLMSFTAHKIYGPRGIGALYVRRRSPQLRLVPLIDGGGQENGMRSGTLNVPGIVGFAKALQLCTDELTLESIRLVELRKRLFDGLTGSIENTILSGPVLDRSDSKNQRLRLPGNLNMSFRFVDGEALIMSMADLAVSSGSACTSANPEPSHVLRSLGLSDEDTRSSLRFGLGRFNTEADVEFAIQTVSETVHRLRKLSSMA